MRMSGGAKLGALTFDASWSLWAVGVEWAIALPGVVWLDTQSREQTPVLRSANQEALL